MKVALAIAAGLLLTACGHREAEVSQQLAGTWKEGSPSGVLFTRTLSANGAFSETLSQSNFVAFTSQGTWLATNGELIITCTNGEGTTRTGQRFEDPSGWVHRYKVIHVDGHQFIGERDGRTNVFSR
jgi:hypothetical protein